MAGASAGGAAGASAAGGVASGAGGVSAGCSDTGGSNLDVRVAFMPVHEIGSDDEGEHDAAQYDREERLCCPGCRLPLSNLLPIAGALSSCDGLNLSRNLAAVEGR